MFTENSLPLPELAESEKPSLHIYLPGIMGSDQGMKPIYDVVSKAVEEHYPGAQFEGKNSYISPDTLKLPDRDRHILLARKVIAALSEQRDVHLYGHSLGAIELSRVMELVKRYRPDLKNDHPDLQKIHIVLMSPAGFGNGLRQTVEMLGRLKNIVTAGVESSGHIYGLETVAYLPIKAKGADANSATFISPPEQAGMINRFHPRESQRGDFGGADGVANDIPFVYQQPIAEVAEKRFAHLSETEKQQLANIDQNIWQHAEAGDEAAVRADLVERGRLLSKYTQASYEGKPLGEEAETTPAEEKAADKATWGLYAQALLGSGRLLVGMLTGKTYKEIKSLHDAGVDISFLVPEYDTLVKMEEIVDLLGKEEIEKKTILLKSTTHSSSSNSPSMLAAAIGRLKSMRS